MFLHRTFILYLHIRPIVLAASCYCIGSATLVSAENEPTDFVRVLRPDSTTTFLQTAITSYSNGLQTVDLVGAVHIADLSYYETLNNLLSDYPLVLFELIGGEKLTKAREASAKPQQLEKNQIITWHHTPNEQAAGSATPPSLVALNAISSKMQEKLDLESQLTHIDYHADNFIHADFTIEEFSTLQKEDGNSMPEFLLQQAFKSAGGNQPSTLGLLVALLSNNPNRLKLQIIDTLGDADEQLASLNDGNLIITLRNQQCFNILDQALLSGKQKIAIFYGAAHFPHMEKLLLARGYKLKNQHWLNAWSIKNTGMGAATPKKHKNGNHPEP